MLSPHSENINSKTNFVIYNAPSKLHDQVKLLRLIMAQKTAQLPSELPDKTNIAMLSYMEESLL